MGTQIAGQIRALQRQANHCAWLFQTHEIKVDLRIIYAAGDAFPWRLVETHRKASMGVTLRRMHYFRDEARLRQILIERANWKRRDRMLVAAHLHRPSAELDAERRTLRAEMCVTKADRVVNLLRRREARSLL